jgi:hypothetical protein
MGKINKAPTTTIAAISGLLKESRLVSIPRLRGGFEPQTFGL